MWIQGAFFFGLLLIFPITGFNQELAKIKAQFQSKPTLDARIETRNSFITNRVAKIRSAKIGLNFNDKVKVGLSYNRLSSLILSKGFELNVTEQRLQYWYVAPYFEYNFYHTDRADLSLPIQLGIGRIGYSQGLNALNPIDLNSSASLVYEAYLVGEWRLNRFVGIGGGVGYRLAAFKRSLINQRLSSPIYIMKAQINLSEIWKSLKTLGG